MGGSCFLLQGTRIADRREAGSRGPETANADSGVPSKLKKQGSLYGQAERKDAPSTL